MRSKKQLGKAVITAAIAVAVLTAMRYGLTSSQIRGKAIASGRFHQVAHRGEVLVTIYQLADKKLLLHLTEFRTDNGRDLQVLLIAAPDAFENETVEKAEYVSVGTLQKSEGDQSYHLPDDLDLSKYQAVTIWSPRYRVNFTTAPLALN